MFQRQERIDLTSRRPGGAGEGGGLSHADSLDRWEKAQSYHELLKSLPNWFSVENECPAEFQKSSFCPVST